MDCYTNIDNKLLLITKKNYTYSVIYTNTPHADGYNLKLEYKEFDRKIQQLCFLVLTISKEHHRLSYDRCSEQHVFDLNHVVPRCKDLFLSILHVFVRVWDSNSIPYRVTIKKSGSSSSSFLLLVPLKCNIYPLCTCTHNEKCLIH